MPTGVSGWNQCVANKVGSKIQPSPAGVGTEETLGKYKNHHEHLCFRWCSLICFFFQFSLSVLQWKDPTTTLQIRFSLCRPLNKWLKPAQIPLRILTTSRHHEVGVISDCKRLSMPPELLKTTRNLKAVDEPKCVESTKFRKHEEQLREQLT